MCVFSSSQQCCWSTKAQGFKDTDLHGKWEHSWTCHIMPPNTEEILREEGGWRWVTYTTLSSRFCSFKSHYSNTDCIKARKQTLLLQTHTHTQMLMAGTHLYNVWVSGSNCQDIKHQHSDGIHTPIHKDKSHHFKHNADIEFLLKWYRLIVLLSVHLQACYR